MNLFEYQLSQIARCGDSIEAINGYLDGATLHLYKSEIGITEETPLSEFVAEECDYTGYAAQAQVWNTPSVSDDETVESLADTLTFRPTDAVTPNEAWGVFMVDTAGTGLLFAAQFEDAPLPMGSAEDVINLTTRFRPASDSMVAVVS